MYSDAGWLFEPHTSSLLLASLMACDMLGGWGHCFFGMYSEVELLIECHKISLLLGSLHVLSFFPRFMLYITGDVPMGFER